MQLELFQPSREKTRVTQELILVAGRPIPLHYLRNNRARRYVMRVREDGALHITIPRGGTREFARDLASRNAPWIEKQLNEPRFQVWQAGTRIYFRGQQVPLAVETGETGVCVRFADQSIVTNQFNGNLRHLVERHLAKLAREELTRRAEEIVAANGLSVERITVRDQKSRWGSCSSRATISLNWRLIQTPPFVRDYIILHELMHLHEMNHSRKFWKRVSDVCPDYELAEAWLKRHQNLLR